MMGDKVFFSGIVSAEMRSKLSFNVKFAVETETGEVIHSECQCAAGKGPNATCKHIVGALLVVVALREDGEVSLSGSALTHSKPSSAQGNSTQGDQCQQRSFDKVRLHNYGPALFQESY